MIVFMSDKIRDNKIKENIYCETRCRKFGDILDIGHFLETYGWCCRIESRKLRRLCQNCQVCL